MRILVIADIHSRFDMLQKIMDEVRDENYDIIVSQGDFTDMFTTTTNFTQMEIADVIVQKLMIPNKPLFCVPGNHDPYELLDIFDDYGINLHQKKTDTNGFTMIGWGGADTPFRTNFEPTEEETMDVLKGLLVGVGGEWILVTHAPPKGTKLDIVDKKKHVGSESIRKIIEKKQPLLALCAHIHENNGTDKIGKTTIFYPGPAYSGYYGFVDIENNTVICKTHRIHN